MVSIFFRSVEIPRPSIVSVESDYLPFKAEPVLVIVAQDQRIRVTSSMAATPMARAKVVDSLSGDVGPISGNAAAGYSKDSTLQSMLSHKRAVVAIPVVAGLLLARLMSLDWIWAMMSAGLTVVIVALGIRGLSKML